MPDYEALGDDPVRSLGGVSSEEAHAAVRRRTLGRGMPGPGKPQSPFRCFDSSPDMIHLMVMIYVRFPLSLWKIEEPLFERGIDISQETLRRLRYGRGMRLTTSTE